MSRFQEKVAIVAGCGAGEGIGSTVAKLLAREGAKVLLADIDLGAALALEAEIRAANGHATACKADMSNEREVKAMVAKAIEKYGAVNCLHYNPMAAGPKGMTADNATDVLELELEVFDYTFAINARGFLLCMKAAIPEMLKSGGGSVVYTSSANGTQADSVRGAYSVAKSAGNMLCKHVAVAYGKHGIRVNAVAPGLTLTHSWKTEDDLFSQSHLRHTLTKRLGRSDDQAKMIVYLLSEDAGYITGQVVHVDGGYLAHGPAFADVSLGKASPGPSWGDL